MKIAKILLLFVGSKELDKQRCYNCNFVKIPSKLPKYPEIP
jgi:hypothetical protein